MLSFLKRLFGFKEKQIIDIESGGLYGHHEYHKPTSYPQPTSFIKKQEIPTFSNKITGSYVPPMETISEPVKESRNKEEDNSWDVVDTIVAAEVISELFSSNDDSSSTSFDSQPDDSSSGFDSGFDGGDFSGGGSGGDW
jgi:uncharacterized membrane protein YgcG